MPSTTMRHRSSLGRPGTTTAYKKGCRCAKCTAANTAAKRRERERAKHRGQRPLLTIVTDDTPRPSRPTDGPEDPPTRDEDGPEGRPGRDWAWGPAEKALRMDIADLPTSTDFGRAALIQGAIALTRQIDDYDFRGSKGPLVKTLVETIRAIRGKEPDDGDTLEGLLAGLAEPFAGPAAGDTS